MAQINAHYPDCPLMNDLFIVNQLLRDQMTEANSILLQLRSYPGHTVEDNISGMIHTFAKECQAVDTEWLKQMLSSLSPCSCPISLEVLIISVRKSLRLMSHTLQRLRLRINHMIQIIDELIAVLLDPFNPELTLKKHS